jgi:DedD protein
MSEPAPRIDPEQSSQALRRGLMVRLGVAIAVLLAIAALALAVLVPARSTTEAAKPPVAASLAPAAIPDPAPSSSLEPGSPPKPEPAAAEPAAAEDSASSAAALQPESTAAGAKSESPAAAVAGGIAAEPAPAQAAEAKAGATKSASNARASGSKPARGLHLQAGVFLQPDNAQALKATLEAQGVPVYIESRVHIGPFRDRNEAERMREKLKELGHSTVLVTQ